MKNESKFEKQKNQNNLKLYTYEFGENKKKIFREGILLANDADEVKNLLSLIAMKIGEPNFLREWTYWVSSPDDFFSKQYLKIEEYKLEPGLILQNLKKYQPESLDQILENRTLNAKRAEAYKQKLDREDGGEISSYNGPVW